MLYRKYAVSTLRVPPLLYYWASIFVQALLGTAMGIRLLAEPAGRRIVAAAVLVLAVLVFAVG